MSEGMRAALAGGAAEGTGRGAEPASSANGVGGAACAAGRSEARSSDAPHGAAAGTGAAGPPNKGAEGANG
jgi:hypothetical protein